MDDGGDKHRELLLDTSILLPMAIAGGVTIVIIVFLYCCRRYKSLLGYSSRSADSSLDTSPAQQRNRQRSSQQRVGRSRNMAGYVQNHFLPWTTGTQNQRDVDYNQQFYTTTGFPRPNYHSTQSTTGQLHVC